MKILHYVDENRLAWGETWIQLIKELTIQGTDNFIVCRPGGTLAARLQEEGLNFETAAPVVQALPFTNTALGRILKREKPDIIHTRLSAAALIGDYPYASFGGCAYRRLVGQAYGDSGCGDDR